MIQLERGTTTTTQSAYTNIYPMFDTLTNLYDPLFTITSHQTGNSKTFAANASGFTYKDRYVSSVIQVVTTSGAEVLSQGKVYLGTDDFPYGFYDVVIRENSSNTNIITSGRPIVYYTLMNLTQTGNAAVTYTEYTTNDDDTESVYITNDSI